MTVIRILGIGSPFGDDQIGWYIVEKLQQCEEIKSYPPDLLQLECSDRPGLRLLYLLQNVDKLILIDAVKTGAPVGTIKLFSNAEIEQVYSPASTHNIGIGYALRLGRQLNLLPKYVMLYGIEIGEVTAENKLSKIVSDCSSQVVRMLVENLPDFYHTHG